LGALVSAVVAHEDEHFPVGKASGEDQRRFREEQEGQ
jgi:hypothetical protein